jgi:hypothetical protein
LMGLPFAFPRIRWVRCPSRFRPYRRVVPDLLLDHRGPWHAGCCGADNASHPAQTVPQRRLHDGEHMRPVEMTVPRNCARGAGARHTPGAVTAARGSRAGGCSSHQQGGRQESFQPNRATFARAKTRFNAGSGELLQKGRLDRDGMPFRRALVATAAAETGSRPPRLISEASSRVAKRHRTRSASSPARRIRRVVRAQVPTPRKTASHRGVPPPPARGKVMINTTKFTVYITHCCWLSSSARLLACLRRLAPEQLVNWTGGPSWSGISPIFRD